eukprot:14988694-Alexandrium_andersonii.AAC.1
MSASLVGSEMCIRDRSAAGDPSCPAGGCCSASAPSNRQFSEAGRYHPGYVGGARLRGRVLEAQPRPGAAP